MGKCLDCPADAGYRKRLCLTHRKEHDLVQQRRADRNRESSAVRRKLRRAKKLGALTSCEICSKPFGAGHMTAPRYDHNHATGQFRGWLCHQCNVALGLMGDDPARLRAAAHYVETRP